MFVSSDHLPQNLFTSGTRREKSDTENRCVLPRVNSTPHPLSRSTTPSGPSRLHSVGPDRDLGLSLVVNRLHDGGGAGGDVSEDAETGSPPRLSLSFSSPLRTHPYVIRRLLLCEVLSSFNKYKSR